MKKLITTIILILLFAQSNNLFSQNLYNIKDCSVEVYYTGEAEKLKNWMPDKVEIVKMLSQEIHEINFDVPGKSKSTYAGIIINISLYKGNIDTTDNQYYGGVILKIFRFTDWLNNPDKGLTVYDDIYYLFNNYSDKKYFYRNFKENIYRKLISNLAKEYYKANK